MLRKIIGRKQSSTNKEFQTVFENVPAYVSLDHIKKVQELAVNDIIKSTDGLETAISYSGGKDATVLAHLCNLAGLHRGCIGITRGLEYKAFLSWLKMNMPKGIEYSYTDQDMKWLFKNQDWALFPNKKNSVRLRNVTHRASEENYVKKYNIEMMIYGRRILDGNFCGTKKIYKAKHRLQYNPIREWSHEEVLGYLVYFNIPLAPQYYQKDRWLEGVNLWSYLEYAGNINNAWDQVYRMEKEIVLKASIGIKSARDYLNKRNQRSTA